jgi:hypothetical protein
MERMSITEHMKFIDVTAEGSFVRLMTYFDYIVFKEKDGNLNEKDLEARRMVQILMKRYETADNHCDQLESLWMQEQAVAAKLKKRISKLTLKKSLGV